MTGWPGRLVLLGHPVAHSLSPRFQNAALRAGGIPVVYEAMDVAPHDLTRVLAELRASNGAGNVTIPHKGAVAAACDELTEVAERAAAVNTFWFRNGRMIGDNTDVGGFQAAVTELRGSAGPPRVVAILGAGGAAAAALSAIERWPGAKARIFTRNTHRTRELARRFESVAAVARSAEQAVRGADLIVNATPIGLADDGMPIDPRLLDAMTDVLDLVYRSGETTFVRAARQLGLRACDGTTMLLEQGALAFERWFGIVPNRAVMRDALAPQASAS